MRSGLTLLFAVAVIRLALISDAALGQDFGFSWHRATVYSVETDGFVNGDNGNDSGVYSTASGAVAGAGGDLKGLTATIQSGYFSQMGVNVLSISPAFGYQIDSATDLESEAFYSLWSYDFASVLQPLGTRAEFQEFIDAAHASGIRVVMEIELQESETSLRLDSTYGGTGPDVSAIIQGLWGQERASREISELKAFFERSEYPKTDGTIAVKWLADWVRTYGLDGYKVTNADRVHPELIAKLKTETLGASRQWKMKHPGSVLDSSEFWVIGEAPLHGMERSAFFDAGFDAMMNTSNVSPGTDIDELYLTYSTTIEEDPTLQIVTPVSSVESSVGNPDPIAIGSRFLLLPGPIQINYGQELGRISSEASASPQVLGTVPMNWESIDSGVRDHWETILTFRQNHPAIAEGAHEMLGDNPYTFYRGIRIGVDLDQVIVVMDATGRVRVNVSRIFPDDTVLKEVFSGTISVVSYGEVAFQASDSGMLLIEEMK